jgi:phosphatidylserine/phosphatidylglycerophosphate/cardiolipin synthase-like enzyme
MTNRRPEAWCLLALGIVLIGTTAYRFVWKSEEMRGKVESALDRMRGRSASSGVPSDRPASPAPAPVFEYEVEPLIGRDYLPRLKEALGRAEKSIRVAMYVVDPGEGRDHPVNQILEALAAARRRGVKVEVIVECPWEKKSPALKKKNSAAIDRLRRQGISAAFDEPRHCLHDKLVIIDDRVVFIGNHNWTKEALTIHDEVSVRIVCRPPDPRFGRYFGYIGAIGGETTEEGRREKLQQFQKELLKRSQAEAR